MTQIIKNVLFIVNPGQELDVDYAANIICSFGDEKQKNQINIPFGCSNCHTLKTTRIRKFAFKDHISILCNACAMRAYKKQYCMECGYVYTHEEVQDTNIWFKCNKCCISVHKKCITSSTYKNFCNHF